MYDNQTSNELTQKERFSAELKRIQPDVTASDRSEAMLSLGIKSPMTISDYLNGKVRDNDTAASLIAFFKERIQKRNEVLT